MSGSGNPLVAVADDGGSAFGGVFVQTDGLLVGAGIFEDASDTVAAIGSGSWVDAALGGFATSMDALGLVLDPLGSLVAMGVSWLMEHLAPLKEALDWLAGDPAQITAHAQTWKNVAVAVDAAASELADRATADLAGWRGAAAEGYRRHLGEQVAVMRSGAKAAEGLSLAVSGAGLLVALTRELVRDLIAEFVSVITVRLAEWAAEELFSLGLASPWVIGQVGALVAEWMAKISKFVSGLLASLKRLVPLIRRLSDVVAEVWAVVSRLRRGGGSASAPVKGPAAGSGSTSPGTVGPGAGAGVKAGPGPGVKATAETDPLTGPGDVGVTPGAAGGSVGSGAGGQVGAAGQGSRSEPVTTCVNDPVDVATGWVVLEQSDVALPGMLQLVLSRKHSSHYRSGIWFGRSWASTVDERVEVGPGRVVVVTADAKVVAYPVPGPDGGAVRPGRGDLGELRADGAGGFTVADPVRGLTRHYRAPAAGPFAVVGAPVGVGVFPLVAVVHDASGQRVEVVRDAEGRPELVRHSGGYRVAIDRTPVPGPDAGSDSAGGWERVVGYRVLPRQDPTTAPDVADLTGDPVVGGVGLSVARFGYDAVGQLRAVFNSAAVPLRFDYDPVGRLSGWQDRNGTWFRYGYDQVGRCVSSSGSDGVFSARFAYQPRFDAAGAADGWVTVFTDALGQVTSYRVNSSFQVVEEIDPLGAVTSRVWDAGDRLVAVTDPVGRTTEYTYDDAGRLVGVVRPDGSRLAAAYDGAGRPVAVTGPDGSRTGYVRDEAGRVVAVDGPDGVTRYAYDRASGMLTEVTDPGGRTTRVEFDPVGLLTAVTDPGGARVGLVRDDAGRVTARTDPSGAVTSYGYTPEGHLARVEHPDGLVEGWTWDGEGNLTSHTDRSQGVRRWEYTHFDVPSVVVAPDGARHEVTYDVLRRVTAVTGPTGLTWRYTYDPAGRLRTQTDLNGATTSYEYDPAGQPATVTTPVGDHLTLDHDRLGRLTRLTGPDTTRTFTWDPVGRLLEATTPEARVARAYDPAGRLVTEAVNGATTTHTWDPAGNRTGLTTPSGLTQTWAYDPTGLPTTATLLTPGPDGTAGAGESVVALDHDRAGRLTAARFLAAANPLTTVQITHTRDSAGRLRSTRAAGPGRDPVVDRSWDYRPDGLLNAITDRDGRRELTLDPAGRITAITATTTHTPEHYTYDLLGNLTHTGPDTLTTATATGSATGSGTGAGNGVSGWEHLAGWEQPGWTPPRPAAPKPAPGPVSASVSVSDDPGVGDRVLRGTLLLRAGRTHYTYDAAGRLTRRRTRLLSGGSRTWTFTWNSLDQLTHTVTPTGDTWQYTYDALGRRITKQRLSPTTPERTTFVWDHDHLTEQHTTWTTQTAIGPGDPGHVTTWVRHPHTGVPLAQHESSARPDPLAELPQAEVDHRFWAIITDLVGTPTELLAPDGTLAWQAHTTLWGHTTPTPTQPDDQTSHTTCPLRFPGQYADLETGLHYNHHRYYDPVTARYLTPDPLGLAPAPNPHTYIPNPTLQTDPHGLAPDCGRDVALGIRDEGLRNFADANGYTHFLDSRTWQSDVGAVATDPDVRLHIRLDGFDGATPAERFMTAYLNGMGDNWYATEWEMYRTGLAVRVGDRPWDSIVFYEGDQVVTFLEPSFPLPGG